MTRRRTPRQRGLSKVPGDAKRLHRAAEEVLRFTEAKVDNRTSRSLYWNLTLDLRDLRSELEGRYPVLAPPRPRDKKIGEGGD